MSTTENSSTATPYAPATADRFALGALMAIGALIGVERAVGLVMRIVSITGPGPHRAPITPRNLEAAVPLGSGDAVAAEITAGTLTVAQLAGAEAGLLLAKEILTFLAIATIIICLILLARNTLRGAIFQRRNTVLLTVAGIAAAFGYGISHFLGQLASNEIISRLSVGKPAVYGSSGDMMPYFLGFFAFGIVTIAYAIGARMQRETEGLV
ncbi:hypothetical protein ACI1US_01224 [Leucobacter sp. BZR 635]